jgi:tetratricopeptide (TPR) repeat protein
MSLITRFLGLGATGKNPPPTTVEQLMTGNAGLHRLFPEDPKYLLTLGATLFDRGDRPGASLVLERALELGAQDYKVALIRAKRALMDGQPKAALQFLQPHLGGGAGAADAELYLVAGTSAWEAEQIHEAIRYYEAGVVLAPRKVELLGSLCGAYGMTGQHQKAYDTAKKALELDRRHCSTLQNLGIAARELLKLEDQHQAYRDLCDFYPDNERFRCLRSYALLMDENFAEGWPLHENRDFRFREQNFRESTLQRPRWKGESLEGKTLLIVCEQGAGDNFMVARWFPEIKKRGARVVLECASYLTGILGRVPGVDQVIELVNQKEPEVHYDLWVASMSLPFIFNVTRENIHAPARYLEPSAASSNYWSERVQGVKELKVGLAWAGNPKHANDVARSMRFADVEPLLDVPGTRFFNLQVPARDLVPRANLMNYTDELVTFDDTAGLIDQMDVVVTVDTSIAHLACALGKPTWVVSSMRPEWRWGRTDLPVIWYPTATLSCCESPLNWASAIAKVAAGLRGRVAARGSDAGRAGREGAHV